MLETLKLLLPALIPSWRFFDIIAPSPRIEISFLKNAQDTPKHWQEFRPRPQKLSVKTMAKRMVWNPQWNEDLFLVSCAERLTKTPTRHSEQEIITRIKTELNKNAPHPQKPYIQFRLAFLYRQDEQIQKHITFTSAPYQYIKGGNA
ncbi:MAG: hypothetical protein ACRBCT_05010 [Alphaproteobacteria bacterium]